MNEELILALVSDFIQNQPTPLISYNSFNFKNGIEILGLDDEHVQVWGFGCEGFQINALELREKSEHFNDLCKCDVCDDRGGHDCENRPLGLGKHSVPFKS